jgi:hypothetical protein
MDTRRWTNPSQPQTLQIAVMIFYFRAVILILFGSVFSPLGLLLTAGAAASGFGIANERRWGYLLGLLTAGVSLLLTLQIGGLISILFAVALLALLLHPQSRDYQRIWFS